MTPAQVKKIIYPLLFLLFGLPEIAESQNEATKDSLLKQAYQFFDEAKEREALNTYLKVLEIDKDNFKALWRTSLLYARIGFRMETEEKMMEHYKISLEYAEKAIAENPESGYAHFVIAVANGRISDLSRSKVRIKKSHIVKKHIQKAVELIPDFAPAWHVYALWHSKVANVGSAQKFAAGVFSKGVPDGASNEKAVAYTLKAIEMDPQNTLRYKVDLARHYRRTGQRQNAIQTLEEVMQMSPQNEIDEWNINRAQEILQEIS